MPWKWKRTIYLSYLTPKFFFLLSYWVLPFSSGLILFWFSYLTQQVGFFTFFAHVNPTFCRFLAQLLYPSLQAHMLSTWVATHYRLEELHIWQFNDVMFFFGYLKYVRKREIEGLYISITLRTCMSVLRRLFLLYNSCNYSQYMWGEVRNFAYILLCCNLILRNLSLLNCEKYKWLMFFEKCS